MNNWLMPISHGQTFFERRRDRSGHARLQKIGLPQLKYAGLELQFNLQWNGNNPIDGDNTHRQTESTFCRAGPSCNTLASSKHTANRKLMRTYLSYKVKGLPMTKKLKLYKKGKKVYV